MTTRGVCEDRANLETYIGNCINMAARVEALTKEYHRTSLLITETFNSLLCKKLFGYDYVGLMNESLATTSVAKRKRLWKKMDKLNESLMLTFMQKHNLRGVSDPVALFRLSPTLGMPHRKEFQNLLHKLCLNKSQVSKVNGIVPMTPTNLRD
jgi:class 3 adenylate cyclase